MGIFIGLRVSKEDVINIKSFQEKIGLKNPVKEEEIHCTLLSSLDHCDKLIDNEGFPIEITQLRLGKIKTQTGVDCLAIFFENEILEKKYEYIKNNYNIKSFYQTLKLHITLSYDCGDIDIEKMNINDYISTIKIVSQYQEILKFEVNKRKEVRI